MRTDFNCRRKVTTRNTTEIISRPSMMAEVLSSSRMVSRASALSALSCMLVWISRSSVVFESAASASSRLSSSAAVGTSPRA
ncbi:hypothetical protein D3C72_2005230 [compost metagenome]